MSKQNLRYLRNQVIEDITAQRIREYEAKVGAKVTFPVPIEAIVEQVLGLDFDWDVIQEQPGEQILGGLDAANRKILINEAHNDLFNSKPGLLRSTIGHEAGHWNWTLIARRRISRYCRDAISVRLSSNDTHPSRIV